MPQLKIDRLSGSDLHPFLPALAELRIRVFREFPYLYEGNEAYEKRYLRKYVGSAESVLVLVRSGGKVVGAATGLPLAHETDDVKNPFINWNYNIDHIFYFGESVVLPEFRGMGLGISFFEEREDHVRSLNRFDAITFCTVERPVSHPRRPTNYIPLDRFWTRRGFKYQPQLRTDFCWQDLDEDTESPKPMVFWMKELNF